MNITHVVVHTPEQVQGIIDEALRIADASDHAVITPRVVFEQACQLLGQRWTFAALPQPVNLAGLPSLQGLKQ